MSIIPSKGNAQKQPEKMPPPPPRPPAVRAPEPPQQQHLLPPEVEEHVIAWKRLHAENARLTTLVQKLENELVLARETIREKEMALDFERNRVAEHDRFKDKYLRFAQEILTRSDNVKARAADLMAECDTMVSRAMQCAHEHETPPAIAHVEDQLQRAVDAATQSEIDEQRRQDARGADRSYEPTDRRGSEGMGRRTPET